MDRLDNEELKEWSQNQPLSILRLDPIDRAILKISGTLQNLGFISSDSLFHSSLAVHKMKNSQSKL
jgi:hypothetical protein